ncbi:RNA methyltransferase [Seleniivibrio sp.]|uniref:RNA methyltransferase n=1 Tax=Seleniivibrio sp. TaxID=2898801 RepID=UPI0025EAC8E3|nr:RNA methyltransferase [Seleniivibrio sp.]MCD8553053.1 RNA methyltransferase [Seleniivibrio sp.]
MKGIKVLLANPEGAVNLGFIARAMANTGFSELVYYGRLNSTHPTALKYALAAENILENARHANDFDDLLSGSDKIIGISMRTPKTEGLHIPLSGLKDLLLNITSKGMTAGLLFGNEKSGLSNTQLSACHRFVTLDTSDVFPSMNLAQAVLVVLWEIKNTPDRTPHTEIKYADRKLTDALMGKMKLFLETFGCLNTQNPDKIFEEIRLMTESKNFTEREVQLLLSVLGKAIAEHLTVLNKNG